MASSSQSGAPVPSEYLRRRTGQLSGCGPGTAACPAPAGRTRVRLSPCPAADRSPMTDPGPTTQLTRTERLDRLPFTRTHGKLLTGSGVGWALDAMDVGLISFVIAQLAVQWQLSNTELGLIASIGFVGMSVGAALGGLLADRLGRRQVFALTLLIYGLATGASALAGGIAVL